MTAMKMNRDLRLFVAASAALILCGATARADYLSETGAIQIISPPPSVKSNDLQDDTFIRTFAEHHELTLTSSVTVDDTAAGTFKSDASLVGGVIGAGTKVDSYYFHSDTTKSLTIYDGSVTFSTAILGVIVQSASLSATDAQLGFSGTKYPAGDGGRGLELGTGSGEDFFSLSTDKKTLTFHFATHSNVDQVRVLTVPSVPEPASLALLGLGGLGLLGLARHLRKPSPARA
jgi:hypothetical protein